MPVLLLEPPYDLLRPFGPYRPTDGTVLIADLAPGIPALAEAMAAHRNAPWCPLVLLADAGIPAATLHAFEPLPGSWAILYRSDYAHLNPARRTLAAVQRRPVPTSTTVAQWIERRLGRAELASTLVACCGQEGDALPPPRTLARRVHELGPLAVRDWRGLTRLARLVASLAPGRRPSLEGAALEAGIDPRTLRRWLRLTTDRCWTQCVERVGWEWVLESALRRMGYFRVRLERREPTAV
jgi:hypothetical protein